MITIRCTRKLAKRLTPTPGADTRQSTSKLGDWYANPLNVGHQRLIHCVSERSLLSIVLPAKDVRLFPSRLPYAVGSLLARLGIPSRPPVADLELALAAVPCLQLEPDAFPFLTAGGLLGVPVSIPEWRVLH